MIHGCCKIAFAPARDMCTTRVGHGQAVSDSWSTIKSGGCGQLGLGAGRIHRVWFSFKKTTSTRTRLRYNPNSPSPSLYNPKSPSLCVTLNPEQLLPRLSSLAAVRRSKSVVDSSLSVKDRSRRVEVLPRPRPRSPSSKSSLVIVVEGSQSSSAHRSPPSSSARRRR